MLDLTALSMLLCVTLFSASLGWRVFIKGIISAVFKCRHQINWQHLQMRLRTRIMQFWSKDHRENPHLLSFSLYLSSYVAKGKCKADMLKGDETKYVVKLFPLEIQIQSMEGIETLWPTQSLQTLKSISLDACNRCLLKILPHLEFLSTKSFWTLSSVEMKTKYPTA